MTIRVLFIVASTLVGMAVTNCAPTEPNVLDKLGTVDMELKGKPFRLWIANDPDERERGLMFVTDDQMSRLPDGRERGMLFVFDHEQYMYFWMKNTIIPLDIAFIDADGVVVATHTMAPLDERPGRYSSGRPARFAIEAKAGALTDAGIKKGDVIEIPAAALNHPF